MKTRINTVLCFTLAVVMFAATASAQQAPSPPPTTPYGAPIGLEAAKKVMAAAEAEATKNNWAMAIIILDSTGHAVMLHKFDNTQYGSIGVAEDKARSALYYKRPTKVFEDLVAQGGIGLRTLALRNASPLEGGIPLIVETLARGKDVKNPTEPKWLNLHTRMAVELGADVIKTEYSGDTVSMSAVIAQCPIPILVLGGSRDASDDKSLDLVQGAVEAGAAGVFFGRNVFQATDMEGFLRKARQVLDRREAPVARR